MCQFHQILIVRRYVTQNPDIETSRELLNLVNIIAKTDKESFCGAFNEWYEKYRDVVNERVHDKRIKRIIPPYVRPKLRSAYLSIKRNMPLLWTFYDHPETGLPNTNNAIEGVFSDLKTKVRVHRVFKLPIQLFHGVPYPELALLGRPTPIDYRSVITPNVQPAEFSTICRLMLRF